MQVLMRASSRLHDRLFQRVMGAPVSFFDTTPLGRIINRFSRDMDESITVHLYAMYFIAISCRLQQLIIAVYLIVLKEAEIML